MARRLVAIMFTDIAGYTSLAQSDEAGALKLLQEQEKLVRPILEAHRGRKVKSIGDGLLIEFPDALDAVECAVELQRRIHEHNSEEGARRLVTRVGIHLGDVQRRGTDILGDAVNIASRIEPLAEPGGVCLSAQVYDQIHNKVAVQLEKLGPKALKGVREPVDVYRAKLPWAVSEVSAGGLALPRLAVLPLTNISPDPKDEYFADGLTEELITVLSQIKGLRVISRTSVNQYKETTKPVAQIGTELGADSVLEGSVRKAGDQLRIAVQLIDTKTDEHRWAQTYDRKLENVFAIQADVAEQTATALRVELLRTEREAIQERPTSSLGAYESYLRGIQAHRNLVGIWSLERDLEAVSHFEAAIRQDPRFSGAYAFLANHLLGAMGITRAAKDTIPRARECAARALELNPHSSETHTAQGNLAFQADLDWGRAEAEFQQAIALNPSSSTAHFWYGYLLGALQRFKESEKHYLAASELDPLSLISRVNLAWNYAISGNLPGSTAMLERMAESYPGEPGISTELAFMYALTGREDEALRQLDTIKVASFPRGWVSRAAVLALAGRPQQLLTLIANYEAGKIEWYVPDCDAATYYALLGRRERALTLLERDVTGGDKTIWNMYQHPFLDSIRDDPRFVSLLRSINLPTTLSRPRWTPRHPLNE